MTANRIIHHIFNQPDLRQVDQSALEQLVETYPYFAAARLLLAQKQFSAQKDLTAPAMKKAQLYSSSPQHLYQLLTEPEPVPVVEKVLDEEVMAHKEITIPAEQEAIEETLETPSEELQAVNKDELIEAADDEIAGYDALTHEVVEETGSHTAHLDTDELLDAVEDEIAGYDALTHEVVEEAGTDHDDEPADEVEKDEIVAVNEEPIKELEADETSEEEDDEIVAVDYEPIKELEAAEQADEILGEEKDEIVAVDYGPIKELEAAKQADEILGEEKDEIVAVDYEPIKELEAAKQADEILGEEKDEIVAVDYEPIKELEATEQAEETPKPAYEPEIEEEEIILTADAEPEGPQAAGLTLPGAAQEENLEEGPIRIHPMDTPAEETTLTFQPLYTEDYFAYKKLKDPNNAEMMNEKAQAEMRSFTDWLRELKDNFTAGQATRNWYQQQMHRLYEDEEPEVSERVEKMAIDSITFNNDVVSETLAEIWVRQHQHAKAIDIYQKLSLLNPDKNAYFAQKIKELQLLTDNNK
jgi:hypothetical protein